MSADRSITIPNLKPGALVRYYGFEYQVDSIMLKRHNLYVKFRGYGGEHVPIDDLEVEYVTIPLQRRE